MCVTVNVTKVTFVQGGAMLESGIKSSAHTRGRIVGGGHGTYVTAIPSKILVCGVTENGEEKQFNVLYPLREALGLKRLVKEKRDKLLAKYPERLTFAENERGYMDLTQESAQEWVRMSGF